MKELFKKVFSRKIIEPFIMFIVSVLVLEFLVFPGLTLDNSIVNILSGIIGVLLGLIVLTYSDGIIREKFEKKSKDSKKEKTEEDGKNF